VTTTEGQVPAPRGPLVRPVDGRVIAGVALGVAQHLGLPTRWVRVGFVVGSVLNGATLLAYALLWGFAPQYRLDVDLGARAEHARRTGRPAVSQAAQRAAEASDASARHSARIDRERLRVLVGGTALLLLGVALLASRYGVNLRWPITGPLLVVLAGAVIALAQLDDAERRRWLSPVGGSGVRGVAQLGAGVVLAVTGVALLVVPAVDVGQLTLVAGATVAVLVGVALVLAPWGIRLWRDLEAERSLRVRETERAEIAAHLHDSVLQTLSLIQRRPGDAGEVVRLARAQERELRDWIYGGEMREGTRGETASVRAAVKAVCAEVEDAEGVPVELVVVGDRPGDEHTAALVQALREAVLNAVRHGGTGVSVFVECAAGAVEVFVRDRGPGFDLAAVPADRLGVRRSVIGRMQRHGGTAAVRSAPGGGTEVALVLPPPDGAWTGDAAASAPEPHRHDLQPAQHPFARNQPAPNQPAQNQPAQNQPAPIQPAHNQPEVST
jgi:signal transduction histidine kinase